MFLRQYRGVNVTMSDSRPRAWFIAASFGTSSEVWMHRQAAGMPGLDLRVITKKHVDPEQFPAEGFELEQLPETATLFNNTWIAQAQRAAWSLRNFAHGGFRGPPAEARLWAELVRRDRPRIALCQYGYTAVRMAPLLASLGVPMVAHFHGYDITAALRGPMYRRGLKKWAPRFREIVVVADYQREKLLQLGCDPKRIHVIPCGAPVSEFTVADRVGQQPCQFVMVGRLTEKKRPDLSLRAFAMCRETCPDARLTVIGDGPMQAECHALAEEIGLSESVEWLGAQPTEVVKARLASAGVFVQHSVTARSGDKEGWPVAIAEAAGSGLPVVATRHASIPSQIEHGVTGLLCDEEDWRTMGEHLRELAADPERRVQMGHAAREKLLAFDTTHQVRELEGVLLAVAQS